VAEIELTSVGDGFLSGTRYTFRLAQLRAFVSSLCVQDIYKGQHIFQRDVAFDGVGGGEDAAAVSAGFEQFQDRYTVHKK
jgi:hypothetical protein